MKPVCLSNGEMTLVDDKYYVEVLNAGPWHKGKNGYAYRMIPKRYQVGNKRQSQYLHHFIGDFEGMTGELDHKNLNKLDNTIENLRAATRSQNQSNRPLRSDNTSGVKGVSFRNGRYYVQIWANGTNIKLGSYLTLEEATQVRNDAADKYHGQFRRDN